VHVFQLRFLVVKFGLPSSRLEQCQMAVVFGVAYSLGASTVIDTLHAGDDWWNRLGHHHLPFCEGDVDAALNFGETPMVFDARP
jgi:hypothetical protein